MQASSADTLKQAPGAPGSPKMEATTSPSPSPWPLQAPGGHNQLCHTPLQWPVAKAQCHIDV